MYKLHGFIEINDQINNTIGVTSVLGELSTYSKTFSKENGYFIGNFAPGIKFVSFSSKQNNNNLQIPIPQGYTDNVLQIAYRAISYAKTIGQNVTVQDISNDLFNQFPGLITDFQTGPAVATSSLKMPEWISWVNPVLGAGNNRIQIWFSDQAFKRQYEEYEVVILNPIDDLMDFMREPTVTQNALDSRTQSRVMELINDKKLGYPETIIRAQTYTVINLLQPNKTFKATWYAIVYGNFGDNPDIIKSKIIEELASVTNISLEIWNQAIPELFQTTEFLLVPTWTNQAILDRTTQAGIYSPFGNVKSILENMVSLLNDFDPVHVETYLQTLNVYYKSLFMYCLSGAYNLNNIFKISDVYSDYINVGTSSQDFSRMSLATQSFSLMLEELIIIAENETQYAQLPTHTRRLTRYGKRWVSRTYNGIQFLIYTKSNDV